MSDTMVVQTSIVIFLQDRKKVSFVYTTYIKQMAFNNISVLIQLHSNTFFAYLITISSLFYNNKAFSAAADVD